MAETSPVDPVGPGGGVNLSVPERRGHSAVTRGRERMPTVIGPGTSCQGTLRATEGVSVFGSFDGALESTGRVVIEEGGQVKATLTADEVTIMGEFDGQLHCSNRLELDATGRLSGEIWAGMLVVRDGGVFNGRARMGAADPGESGAQRV